MYAMHRSLTFSYVLGQIAVGAATQPFISTNAQSLTQPLSDLGTRQAPELHYKFVTRPDIGAPRWDIRIHDKEALSPGYWFVAPYADLDQKSFPKWNGPHIYDSDGELIWSGAPLFDHWNAFDFRAVQVGGSSMLSLILPHAENAEGVILDNRYEVYKNLDLTGDKKKSNMHDFTIVDDGEVALTLSDVEGRSTLEQSKAIGWEGRCKAHWEGFKEIRVRDGKVLFDWSARDWIGMNESTFINAPLERRCDWYWDILHLNSIDKFAGGDYLISSRHMDAIYRISHKDGHVVWRLGGKKSDFKLEGSCVFSRQHHARVHAENDTHTLISLFDNAHGDGPERAEHPTNEISRGLLLALRTDMQPMTAELIAHYDHPRGGFSNSRGSMQYLPNGNVLMGWTYQSRQSEHTEDGRLLMEASFRDDAAHSYRNFKFPWVGRPATPPAVYGAAMDVNDTGHITTTAYVSWNGATEVKSWRLYKSTADGTARSFLASAKRQGFETAFSVSGYAAFIVVEARDVHDKPLEFGTSDIVKTSEPINMDGPDVAAEMQWLQSPFGDSSSGFTLRQRLLSQMRHPITLISLGLVISAIAFWVFRRRMLNSSSFRWRRKSWLYAFLSDRPHNNDCMPESSQEFADEFELDSNNKYHEDDDTNDFSKPLMRRRADDEFAVRWR